MDNGNFDLDKMYAEILESQIEYILRGVCSDCGACSLKEAEGKCRPRFLDYCAGENLWRDYDE